jgi:hypothetical protein
MNTKSRPILTFLEGKNTRKIHKTLVCVHTLEHVHWPAQATPFDIQHSTCAQGPRLERWWYVPVILLPVTATQFSSVGNDCPSASVGGALLLVVKMVPEMVLGSSGVA